MIKRVTAVLLALVLLFAVITPLSVSAKTVESAKAENIFVYATNADGKAVLLKVVTLDELKAISHGQPNGENYYISSTDNYPTTQYCEAVGITIPELIEYVKRVTTVAGADKLTFAGGDTIKLMATDSFGNYNRSWTYNELYGTPRYYFEQLFTAWKSAWEIACEDDSKFGVTLDEYNEKYRATDPYYADKLAVFGGGVPSVPILATESFSGRTTADALVASTEVGIAEPIRQNGGVVAGSLKSMLTEVTALRLALPMTEADLYAAHRTAFDNFKWTYNLRLDMAALPQLASLGTVAEPIVSASVSGDTLTFTVSSATAGASVYYSFDGAPQLLYTKPVTVDVAGRDLAANPITLYVTAVREGYDDAGIVTVKYPGLSPSFKTLYSGMIDEPLTFEATDAVSASDWRAWTGALTFVTLKAPGSAGYVRIDGDKISADNAAKTITLDASLFGTIGSYSFVFHAAGYADKSASLTIKQPTPNIQSAKPPVVGEPLTFIFADDAYKAGAVLYVTPPSGERVMLSSAKLETYVPEVAGEYKLQFVNSKYEPSTVDLTLRVTNPGERAEFLLFGDIQVTESAAVDFAAWEQLAKAAVAANPDAAFALQAGDIVENGASDGEWSAFLSAKDNALGALPFYSTNGNHESNFLSGKPEKYLQNLTLPQNGPDGFKGEFYSFDYGNVHIASLNSWVFSGEQKLTDADLARLDAWVRNDLLTSRATWKIVLTHLPLYAVHSDANAEAMRRHWQQIFEECGVTLVLVGHQHVYSRLEPQNGITQIMANSGLKFYDSADETLAARTIYNVTTYQTISVVGDTLTVRTFDINGNELDFVELTPSTGAPPVTRGAFVTDYFPQGEIRGYGNGKLGLDDYITRAQIAILLTRAINLPEATSWDWAVEHSIFAAYDDPRGFVTTEDITEILGRFTYAD
jgi:hypothetical protein